MADTHRPHEEWPHGKWASSITLQHKSFKSVEPIRGHSNTEDLVGCQHCGKTFLSPAAFDNHAWQVYYREHFHPKRYRAQP
jgi:hypothetical protein